MKNHLNHWAARFIVLCWGCLLALSAQAHGFAVGELFVRHPYAVPSLAGSQNGAVYFKRISCCLPKPKWLRRLKSMK